MEILTKEFELDLDVDQASDVTLITQREMLLEIVYSTLMSHSKTSLGGYLYHDDCPDCIKKTLAPRLYKNTLTEKCPDFQPFHPNAVFIIVDGCGLPSLDFNYTVSRFVNGKKALAESNMTPGNIRELSTVQMQSTTHMIGRICKLIQ